MRSISFPIFFIRSSTKKYDAFICCCNQFPFSRCQKWQRTNFGYTLLEDPVDILHKNEKQMLVIYLKSACQPRLCKTKQKPKHNNFAFISTLNEFMRKLCGNSFICSLFCSRHMFSDKEIFNIAAQEKTFLCKWN